jgi:hypothetical protein
MKVEKVIKKLSSKFKSVEEKGNKIIFKTFYKNGNLKQWYSIDEVENGEFRLTRGGFQLRNGSIDLILETCLNYID